MNRWLRSFFANQAAGGIVMLCAAAMALFFANSPWHGAYHDLTLLPLPGGIDLRFAVSDILMPIFFLFVGLELKYEMLQGTLATRSQRILPLVAALGGIVLPAIIYMRIAGHDPALTNGWAIPTATDIAFAICIVNLAGPRVPAPAKIFLLAIAIYDDLAAIIIIALFYSEGLALMPLALSGIIIAVMLFLNLRTKAALLPILLLGLLLGFMLHEAGIHTTVAGMITGLCIARPFLKTGAHALHPYVVFGILPLFAFVSAGVDMRGLSPASLLAPLPFGIAAALFFGKQLGIFLVTFATVKTGLASMPQGMNLRILYGISLVAGIGFTMSLFIGQLAFADDALRDTVKLGVLSGSTLSALGGLLVLSSGRKNSSRKTG